jgi:hypothetical protein
MKENKSAKQVKRSQRKEIKKVPFQLILESCGCPVVTTVPNVIGYCKVIKGRIEQKQKADRQRR